MGFAVRRLLGLVAVVFVAGFFVPAAHARPANWVIKGGKLYVDGQWVFLKTAKPLRNFADANEVNQLIADLEILAKKNYNCIEINCYWHHFATAGDGSIDMSLDPLRKLIDAIHARGMFPCLSVETYGVGGGQLPEKFWKAHPDAVTIDSLGKPVRDDEYGVMSAVPSLFSAEYLKASRAFIENITREVDQSKILYFETTVEPQFMGNHALDFSVHGRRSYETWLKKTGENGPAFPESFPVAEEFLSDGVWNRFKAEALADWVNRDAAVFRKVAGDDAYVAVDYLETCGKDMRNRNGDSIRFLESLTAANIIQVNWHWHVGKRTANQCAYEHVRDVMKRTGRDWTITEHMTINGSDYRADDMEKLLRNTIKQGTQFGWEFVSVGNNKSDFNVYDTDWSPKAQIKVVDDNWEQWMKEIRAAAEKKE